MSFRRGTPGIFDGPGPNARFTPGGELRQGRPGTEGHDGDPGHLLAGPADLPRATPQLSLTDLQDRARQTSFLVPGLAIAGHRRADRRGDRGDVPARRRHLRVLRVPRHGHGGHRRHPAAGPGPVHRDGADAGRRRATWSRPTSSATWTSTSRCAGATGTTPVIQSYVNIIATPKGGTHVAGFERALTKCVQRRAAEHPAAQGGRGGRQGRRAGGHDGRRHRPAGRAAVRGPDQGGARHPGRVPAGGQGRRARADRLPRLDQGGHPGAGRPVLEKVVGASRARVAARQHREAQRRKNALESSSLPAKLVGLPQHGRRPVRAVHRRGRLGAGHCEARRGTRSSRRCCRSAARSSTSRRPRSATC